ncbi:hypothetical protein [Campylobacter sp. JMF_08 NE1]|uniref:hypothetical protein n=1 Tax=Campylobacter sp. JMF_08 NE1 TaxID=2983821 RepID=UPI0022E9AABB|nr:hypothetical protein [Campylobacter sp. JMF_08 NE1]MDA3048215.1 hypothetical protein [Campylobacter sp. JMF_08 NE1]
MAVKRVLAYQIQAEMKAKKSQKQEMTTDGRDAHTPPTIKPKVLTDDWFKRTFHLLPIPKLYHKYFLDFANFAKCD